MTDRSAVSHLMKSEESTKQLWEKTYKVPLALRGAIMYRCPSPVGKLSLIEFGEMKVFANLSVTIHIENIDFSGYFGSKLLKLNVSKKKSSDASWTIIHNVAVKPRKGQTSAAFSGFKTVICVDNYPRDKLVFDFQRSGSGCCSSPVDLLQHTIPTVQFLDRTRSAELIIDDKISCDGYISKICGRVSVPEAGSISLTLSSDQFENVIMPETLESLWGPIPLLRLPAGKSNHCMAASHRLFSKHSQVPMFTVRVIHSIPLQMSCVQIFFKDRLVAISHLVGTDQLPHAEHPNIQNLKKCPKIDRILNERVMLVKDASGDRFFVSLRRANMPKGASDIPGNPGSLLLSFYCEDSGEWHFNIPKDNATNNLHLSFLESTAVNLKLGKIIFGDLKDVPAKLGVIFSVAVLTRHRGWTPYE